MLIVKQFPMSEYVKDVAEPKGWKTILYNSAGQKRAASDESDGAPLTADGMDEGAEDDLSDVEGDAE